MWLGIAFHTFIVFYSLDVRAELAQFLIEMFVAAIDMINAADFGLPVGFKPASTSAAEARRSLAITGAPNNRSTPWMTAVGAFESACALPSASAPPHACSVAGKYSP